MEVILVLLAFLFLGFPVLVIVLWTRVSSLEDKLNRLSAQLTAAPQKAAKDLPPPLPVAAASSNPAQSAVVAAPATTAAPVNSPVPVAPQVQAPSVPASDPLDALRDMGLLPPTDLKGEFALGSWWAVRVGGALAVAAVVFLGIWLNLRSTLPTWVRLGEILALGGLGLWGGYRLERTRRDLGRVVFAVGLTVFQFAAWASYGMEKMRVLETPAQAGILQFCVALAVGVVALARKGKLIGQISIVFTTVAVALSEQAGADDLIIGVQAGAIAALGAVLLARGGWASSAVLGLLGALLSLLLLHDGRPNSAELTWALQLGAGLTFLSLWLADRFGRVASNWDETAKNAFLCAAFFGPAVLAVWFAVGSDDGRSLASLVVAIVAVVVGFLEFTRRRVAAEILLCSALVFAAAAGAWKVEQRLVWAVWIVAAALTQLIYARTRNALLLWLAEGLAALAIIAYLNQSPVQPWLRLAAPAGLAALAAWRFGWGQESNTPWLLRRIFSLIGLAVLVCYVQSQFPAVDQPWAWLVVLPIAAVFREPKLLWALLPAFAWSHVVVLSYHFGRNPEGILWPMVWALVLAVLDGLGVWLLRARQEAAAFAFVSAFLLMKAWAAWVGLPSSPVPADGFTATLWLGGIAMLAALSELYRRLGTKPSAPLLVQLAFIPAFIVLSYPRSWSDCTLALTPVWLLGLALALYALARHSLALQQVGMPCRTVVVVVLGLIVFSHFSELPGAGTSLFWALAAALTFILGFALKTRSYRMLGIVGLVIATGHVILFDIHDILGRIVACAAVAIAFFGVAWLYGKVLKKSSTDDV
ncbi:MAG: hypothetical protein CAK89_03830 [Opitutia bacterium AMD-G3]|nr:MAG: hypothetical protein CAK89_03830 [Opitutae bacterium AMD-G3]